MGLARVSSLSNKVSSLSKRMARVGWSRFAAIWREPLFSVRMNRLLQRLRERSLGIGARIALPEAQDERILAAAAEASSAGLCRPILVGDPEEIHRRAAAVGVDLATPGGEPGGLEILRPEDDPELSAMAEELEASLQARKIPALQVPQLVRDPLVYANLLVRHGKAEGSIMGAVATTAETLRSALRVVGMGDGHRVVTSCFLMCLQDARTLVYADCGVVPTPDAEQLADIAIQAAGAYRLLVGGEPRVALLSFSTKGSARHPALNPVLRALEILRLQEVDFQFDGELQADAALVPAIGASKAGESPVAGRANVLIFPDLNSGNIAYKITERLANARAIGPLLLGLDRPVHDLSRGCSVADILDTMAITSLQAGERRTR